MTTNNPRCKLLELPTEIYLKILSHLGDPSKFRLRSTCTGYRNIIEPPDDYVFFYCTKAPLQLSTGNPLDRPVWKFCYWCEGLVRSHDGDPVDFSGDCWARKVLKCKDCPPLTTHWETIGTIKHGRSKLDFVRSWDELEEIFPTGEAMQKYSTKAEREMFP